MTTFTGQIPRDLAQKYGAEALAICERGAYVAPSGARVSIADMLRQAIDQTVSYPPGHSLPPGGEERYETAVEVVNETTLSAVQRLLAAGYSAVALNFASATEPGGGFLNGARAQEEYLARSSGLHACLRGNRMYAFHREQWTPFYTDYAILSPGVPVFRDDSGDLLEAPYPADIITCAAVNARKVPDQERMRIAPVMRSRIDKVLAIGHAHGYDAIVLGAWGCGAFENDPAELAELFRQALAGPFAGKVRRVVFAIVDWSPERRTIAPFERALAALA